MPKNAIMINARLTYASLLATLPSAVDPVRQALQAKSDRWFHWLVISSVAVMVGVAFEAPEATIALRRWYLHWRERGDEVGPPNERSLVTPASYLGLLLVILGVAGEGVFEAKASSADTALRAHDEAVLADALKNTGDAKSAAGAAEGAATNARLASDGAVARATEVGQKVAVLKERANTADKEVGSALALAGEIEQRFAPRALSPTKRELLIALLSKIPQKPKDTILVGFDVAAFDGQKYAQDIVDAINDPATGFNAKLGDASIGDGDKVGVLVGVRDLHAVPGWVGGLLQALQLSGVGGTPAANPRLRSNSVSILVCRKY